MSTPYRQAHSLLLNTTYILFCLFSLMYSMHPARAQITITEVMFNPAGDENTREWVEIYNASDSNHSIHNYMFQSASGVHALSLPPDSLQIDNPWLIPPQTYAVIHDEPYWASFPRFFDDIIPDTIPRFGVKLTLPNSAGHTLRLLNADSIPISEYTYSTDNPDGYSDEKILPEGPDTPVNWGNSLLLHGTPGRRNSVTPHTLDLAITAAPGWSPVPARSDTLLETFIPVQNVGLQPSDEARVTVYRDRNQDSIFTESEILRTVQIPPLLPGDSVRIACQLHLPSGIHHMLATLEFPGDEETANDSVIWELPVRYPIHSVVINEIMYDPHTGDPEWIELYNVSSSPLNVYAWQFGDLSSVQTVIDTDLILSPEEFLMVSETSSLGAYDYDPSTVYVPDAFPVLNNSGDHLYLRDAAGALIDSVVYAAGQGGSDGVSLERRVPFLSGIQASNWSSSLDPAGATPGRRNSIAPADYDLAITQLRGPRTADPGESISLTAHIVNMGMEPIADYVFTLFRDQNEDQTLHPKEFLASESGGPLSPGDSILHTIPVEGLPGGSHRIAGLIEGGDDNDPGNNIMATNILVGYLEHSVRINEIMYRPEPGEPEWIEILVVIDSLDLRGFVLRDQGHAGTVARTDKRLYYSGDYIVLAADSSVLQSYPDADFPLEPIDRFPIFNNGADSVRVLDGRHVPMDEFHYTSRWGGEVGISLERKSVSASTQNSRNWGSSTAGAGATPGHPNSIRAAGNHLLAVARADSIQSVPPGEPFSVAYDIINTSLDSTIIPEFILGLDEDKDGALAEDEYQKTIRFRQMTPGDSLRFSAELRAPASPGDHNLLLLLDHQSTEFTDTSSIWVPFPRQSLLFNEFLPDPSEFYPHEFIECVNVSGYHIPLDRWQLQINNRTAILNSDITIPPKAYFLLSEDSLTNTDVQQFHPSSWPPLPNTGGTILLRDRYGHLMDSLTYSEAWSPQQGRSYERFHLETGDHSPANWQVSLSGEGATPGKPNSLYSDTDTTAREWTITPALFSPDGDGIADFLQVRYQGQAGLQYVTIHIYDMAGRLVRSLIQDQSAPVISVWTWDGTNGRDNSLPIGIYLVHIEYETIEGKTGELLEKAILARPL